MEISETRPKMRGGGSLRRIGKIPEIVVIIPLVIFVLFFGVINSAMWTKLNLLVTLRALSYAGIIAVGMTLLMIVGEIDLSVGSVAGLCGVVFAWLMKEAGWSVGAAALGGLLTGTMTGLVNGLMTVRVRLPAFVSTLSMMYVARGINYVLTEGYPVYPLPDVVGEFGAVKALGVSWPFAILIVLVIIGDFLLRQTIFGSMVTATGGNKEAARIAGIKTDWVKIVCFILTGMLSAVAGMLVVARIKTGDPIIGYQWELDVIASAVIGGVSLLGGTGTILGAFFGTILMQTIRSGLVIIGVSAHYQNVAIGVILIAAASVDVIRHRSRRP